MEIEIMALIAKSVYHDLEVKDLVVELGNKQLPKLEFKGARYKAKFVRFNSIHFDDIVHFENVDLGIGLAFVNCTFDKHVKFINNSANGYEKVLNFNNQSILFKDCIFNSTVQFSSNESELERALAFEGCILNKGIQIEKLKVKLDGIKFFNCRIEEKFDISDVVLKMNLSFSSNKINTQTRIETIEADSITFTGENEVHSDVFIRVSNLRNGIIFNYGIFNKEVKVSQVVTGDTGLNIIGSTFEKPFYVNYQTATTKPRSGIEYFYIKECNFKGGFYAEGIKDVFADEPIIKGITIVSTAELRGDINFSDLSVGELNLKGINVANLVFERIWVNKIKIKALMNNGGLIFSGVRSPYFEFKDISTNETVPTALYIDGSNFGKAQFFQVNFSDFESIYFSNNIITEISTSLVKWFSPSRLNTKPIEVAKQLYFDSLKTKDDTHLNKSVVITPKQRIVNNRIALVNIIKAQREIFRQLKVVSQKQLDNPTALEFQRFEMNYYRQELKFTRPKNRVENFILWTSQTNNFGQNWFKAFILLLVFSFVFYIPIGFLTSDKLDYTKFITSSSGLWINLKIIFWDNLKIWLVLFNPAHRVKDINENIDNYSSWIYFLDILSRIIVSYFIFQIISAFRKFNK